MHLKYNILFFLQYLIIYDEYIFTNVEAIIGENVRTADLNEFPFVVAILRRRSQIVPARDVACAGTLLAPQFVLTSEHCVTNYNTSGLVLIIGSSDLLSGEKFYPAWWISYDQWATRNRQPVLYAENDFLMLKVTEAVRDEIYPTVLSTIPNTRLHNLNCVLASWGVTSNGTAPRFLKTAAVQTLTFAQCKARIDAVAGHGNNTLQQRFICSVANPHVLLGNGDSGGPILYSGAVIGINRGLCPDLGGQFHAGKVNIHFAIHDYEEFIEDILYSD